MNTPACLTPEALRALGAGRSAAAPQQQHLDTCASCRDALRTARQVTSPLEGDLGPEVEAVPLETPGRYERVKGADGVTELLGRGGYGRVELARDHVIGRDVALKTLSLKHLSPSRRGIAEHRLLQEARVVGQLEHPAIVPLHDLARTPEGQLFYAMRRIRGRTLSAAVAGAKTLEERLRLLPHVLAACHALAYAHSRGVLHRDLKPENVMVDRFGETMVIDWGLASTGHLTDSEEQASEPETSGALRLVGDETLSDGRGRLGTPAYMSPEQLNGLRALIDEKTDVWGLGGILFEVLTGRAPREDGPLTTPPPKVRTLVPDIPVDLAALCDKALETSRDARYQSAEALAQDLDAWLHGRLVTAHAYRPLELLKRFVRQHRVTVLVASVAALALLVLGAGAAMRVREERNQARDFALLLAGEVLERIPFDARDAFRSELTARVSDWLQASPVEGDRGRAAHAWAQLVSDFSAAGRGDDARVAAAHCLAVTGQGTSPVLQASALECRISLIYDDAAAPLAGKYERLTELWGAGPPWPLDSKELASSWAYLARVLTYHAANLGGAPARQFQWTAEGMKLARRVTELAPDDPEAWTGLSGAEYLEHIRAVNLGEGENALRAVRDSVTSAQRAHALGHSQPTLQRLAIAYVSLHDVQRTFPDRSTPEQEAASGAEVRRLFDALIALDPSAPTSRRNYATFLLDEGEVTRGWALVQGLPPADFEDRRAEFYLSILAGVPAHVLGERAKLEAEGSYEQRLLLTLALERAGMLREAAAQARLAAQQEYASIWPIRTMKHWAGEQTGPSAPALRKLVDEISRSHRSDDSRIARTALEDFAVALDALEPSP